MFRHGCEPGFWGDDNFVFMRIQPGAPPAECAVGDDIMMAQAHQLHIPETALPCIPIYKDKLMRGGGEMYFLHHGISSEKTRKTAFFTC